MLQQDTLFFIKKSYLAMKHIFWLNGNVSVQPKWSDEQPHKQYKNCQSIPKNLLFGAVCGKAESLARMF